MANSQRAGQVSNGSTEHFGGAGSGHGDLMGKPRKCVGVDQFVGAPGDAGVAAVAFKVRTNIPAINASWGP